ncbi:Mrp/NBP35 family ATP-binding protein [Caldinitratiruptor microaerophilus]|uniref:Iron-sulfur cluster carrier protein n=1 Tax=Caldinitratiruptor microaerophilus TaxID=671077 RepID=A0AA35CNY2_9FIRM|nr:Mrp/NBP35 family ATP-binding protein [Caldinitratiruptor microaerophilus]BDG62003.1 hypothetical protein caldi_30930 [Caldinitratiruptor microaerophilus]
MTPCAREIPCALCPDEGRCGLDGSAHDAWLLARRLGAVTRRVLVLSNKGGVGKSTVAANLAAALALDGAAVGLADADITGPSVPLVTGLQGQRLRLGPEGAAPAEPLPGFRVASIGFLLESPDESVMWRDAYKYEFLRQLFAGVAWGRLDWLVVDMPPGTGGELIAVRELLGRVDGAVLVTTANEVALQHVRRAATACRASDIPILGMVENMSGLVCPHCGGEVHPFGEGGGEAEAARLGVPFLGRVPFDPAAVAGGPVVVMRPASPAARALREVARRCRRRLEGAGAGGTDV